MLWFRKRVLYFSFFFLYSLLFFLLILYWMYTDYRIPNIGPTFEKKDKHIEGAPQHLKRNRKVPVEIWGKASISLYLWKHILKGPISSFHNNFMNVGNLTLNNFEFAFKNGPGFIQTTVPNTVEYLVLVLNGRSADKVKQSEEWLKYLRSLKHLKKACVVLLGSEQCENDWILPYMKSRGGTVDVAFLVYDSVLVDNKEFFQWPLGVAEYRGFPDFPESSIDLLNKRPYKANFVGTVYRNSSREALVKLIKIKKWTDKIRIIERNEWIPNETRDTRQHYIEALQLSDLTLSPVGMNTECYRIYEAMSLGSVPVVEDVVTPGICDHSSSAPLRLLKQMQAPVIWITDWMQLENILYHEETFTFKTLIRRRIKVVNWYKNFKYKMKTKFLEVLSNTFFN